MKVKCIDNSGSNDFGLTYGKIYDVIKCDGAEMYMILNDLGIEQSYFKKRFEVVTEKQTDTDYIDKIAELINKRRNENPLQQEINRLFNEMYPSDNFMNVYKLGYASALADLKNSLRRCFCKDCKECIDKIINSYMEDKELVGFLKKLIKETK